MRHAIDLYDSQLDEDRLLFLSALRVRSSDEPTEEILKLLREDMPGDLKAWLCSYAYCHGIVSLCDIEFSASNRMPLSVLLEEEDDLAGAQRVDVED